MSDANKSGVRNALADAEPVTIAQTPVEGPGPDKPTNNNRALDFARAKGHNGGPIEWNEEEGMPPGCRVRPVGVYDKVCIFLDAMGQLQFAKPQELGASYLPMYFAADEVFMAVHWPSYGQGGNWTGFKTSDIAMSIQRFCARAGIWNDLDRVRGRGCWRNSAGELIVHCGNTIYTDDGEVEPGIIDGLVYPSGSAILSPQPKSDELKPASDPEAAAQIVQGIINTWNWRRGKLDARLFFGSIVAGFLGGALKWRPSVWTTGEAAAGKSTLQDLRRQIMGGWSLNTADPSSAGIYSKLKFDAISVTFDEAESGPDNRKLNDIVKLARLSASGDALLRGSSTHVPVSFSARNTFSFSSINSAPLRGQDMSRIPELDLYPLHKGSEAPVFTRRMAANWGREMLRRAMNNWDRFDSTLEMYRQELGGIGHDSRGQDTFGTLLACADLVLTDRCFLEDIGTGSDPDGAEIWDQLAPVRMPEYFDRSPNWQACLEHLLSTKPRDWRQGGAASIGGLLSEFIRYRATGAGTVREIDTVQGMLASAGCALVARPPDEGGWHIGISNQHPALFDIFDQTDWPGLPNAPGGWSKAIKRGPSATVKHGAWQDAKPVRFTVDGQQKRGICVRLDHILDLSVLDNDVAAAVGLGKAAHTHTQEGPF